MSRPVFLKGALALSISAFFSKLLGLFYVIPLKHIAGDEGLALYQAVFPIYNTLLILAVSGIPVALSKLISEQFAKGDYRKIQIITRSAFRIMVVTAVFGFVLLYAGAGKISQWIGTADTMLSVRAMAYAMLLVPFVALLRGYFYGHQRMNLSAVSQVVEQIVRVSVMVLLVYIYMSEGRSMDVVASGAALGSFAGVAAALLMLAAGYIRMKPGPGIHGQNLHRGRGYGWKILSVAIPVSLSTLTLPLLGMIDSLSVIQLLKESGLSEWTAKIAFGVYSRGVPIVQFAAFYATGLSVAVVPALAAAGSEEERRHHIYRAVKITTLIGLPASIGMMMTAGLINVVFYGNGEGSEALRILASSTLFLSLAVSLSGILQGIGRAILPAVFLLVGGVCKVSANIWLIPRYGISGAAGSTVLTYGLIAVLTMIAVLRARRSDKLLVLTDLVKWVLPSLWMGGVVMGGLWLLKMLFPFPYDRFASLWILIATVAVGALSYLAGLLMFKAVSLQEGKQILTGSILRRKNSKR